MKGTIIIEDESASMTIASNLSDITSALHKLSIDIVTAHWNLRGYEYGILHPKLGNDYHEVLESMDKVAERSVVLGGSPFMSTQISGMNPNTLLMGDVFRSYENVQQLINYFINNDGNKDEVSKNMLTDIQEQLQKMLGFLNQTYTCPEMEEEKGEYNEASMGDM